MSIYKNCYKSYKGYITIVQQDAEAQLWHGRILGIPDVITFEAQTGAAAEQEFRNSVDAYLSFCKTLGRPADLPDLEQSRQFFAADGLGEVSS